MLLSLLFLTGIAIHCAGIQVTPASLAWGVPFVYHDQEELTQFLRQVVHYFPELASLYSIGRSVQQRDLWVLKLSARPTGVLGVPNVKFVGNIHGNEPVGRELILHLIEYLVKNYQTDEEVKSLLDSTVIHFLPSMNPDGFAKSKEGDCVGHRGRENNRQIDLNRSFPDYFQKNRTSPIQPETEAMMNWLSKTQFILSASLHSGALVANYPFENLPDSNSQEVVEELIKSMTKGENIMEFLDNLTSKEREGLNPQASLSPDDDVFKHLASTYANNHLTMHKGRPCKDDAQGFPGGITNGAAWYSVTGGMQDYNYVEHGCMEITLEVSCCKYPHSKHLSRLWDENKKAMLEFAKQAQLGLRGMVMDSMTGNPISGANLSISGRSINFTSSETGEFWRILLPGFYTLEVHAEGYQRQTFPFDVKKSNASHPTSSWLNVYLRPNVLLTQRAAGHSPIHRSNVLTHLGLLLVSLAQYSYYTHS